MTVLQVARFILILLGAAMVGLIAAYVFAWATGTGP